MNKRKCKHCKTPGRGGVVINMSYFCDMDHAIKYAQANAGKAREKARAKESTANKKAVRAFNQKDLKWQHKQTQKAFNKMRVLQEMEWFKREGCDPYCISCGKINMDWCCGHFKTVGAQGILRYDENNTFLQCNKYCNMSLSGNIEGNNSTLGYKKGLAHRFGKGQARDIVEYCDSKNEPKKWEWQELESMREGFNESIRNMTKP